MFRRRYYGDAYHIAIRRDMPSVMGNARDQRVVHSGRDTETPSAAMLSDRDKYRSKSNRRAVFPDRCCGRL